MTSLDEEYASYAARVYGTAQPAKRMHRRPGRRRMKLRWYVLWAVVATFAVLLVAATIQDNQQPGGTHCSKYAYIANGVAHCTQWSLNTP